MRILIILCCILSLALFAGCGGGAPAEKAADLKEKAADTVKEKKAEAEKKTEEVKKTVEEKLPEPETQKPAAQEMPLKRILLKNRLTIEGIVVKEDKKEITLRTEVGTVTLNRDRIEKIDKALLPERIGE